MTALGAGLVVPTLSQIWRYPVKSLSGEPLAWGDLGPQGLVGDRTWAVLDEAGGAVVSAKHDPRMLYGWADTGADGQVSVGLPGLPGPVPVAEASDALSGWLDRRVRTVAWGETPEGTAFDFGFALEPDVHTFSDLGDWLHLLTTGTLAYFAGLGGGMTLAEAVRRTRPVLLVDAGPEPFAEDSWVGTQLTIGDAVIKVTGATSRCVMIERAQPGLPPCAGVLDRLREERSACLGVYAAVRQAGRIRVGQPVTVAEAAVGVSDVP